MAIFRASLSSKRPGLFLMRYFFLALLLIFALCPGVLQAQNKGAEGPAAAGLNPIFSVGTQWTLYGAPQKERLGKAEFEAIIADVRDTKFSSAIVQVVVILRDSQVEGTIGLVEKRGRRAAGLLVEPGGAGPYDVWHAVGYNRSPEKILSDCRENVLAAEDTYRDLPVSFTAKVQRVAKDPSGDLFVEFSIKNQDMTLRCYPWENAPQRIDLPSLRTGDQLKVSGQFTQYGAEYIKLRGCLFSR